jgi:hypothetical protein
MRARLGVPLRGDENSSARPTVVVSLVLCLTELYACGTIVLSLAKAVRESGCFPVFHPCQRMFLEKQHSTKLRKQTVCSEGLPSTTVFFLCREEVRFRRRMPERDNTA